MNQKNGKNSLGIDSCFEDLDNPIELFKKWFAKAEKTEINDPNAVAVATSNKDNQPNVRMVLLKGLSDKGFVFYTNFNSKKGSELKENLKASMCFHWKSLRRQVRVIGSVEEVSKKEADDYYNSRPYKNRIGAWASSQSQTLDKRNTEFSNEASIETYKDHRMAMAFAPLASEINITINNPDVVNKSYPSFWEDMKKAGYDII